jgi:hypothetical protein
MGTEGSDGRNSFVLDSSFRFGHNVSIGRSGPASSILQHRRGGGTSESLSHPLLVAALWIAAILALLALAVASLRTLTGIAVSGLGKWRGGSADDQPSASELLTKFQDVHARGGLSDDEYRTIKTKLAMRLDAELNANDKTG